MTATHTESPKLTDRLSEDEERRRGKLIATILRLRVIRKENGGDFSELYRTEWGTKTALGLFRTMERLVLDGE